MRITSRISSAGKFWHPDWPSVELDRVFHDSGRGEKEFDEAEFRRQMKDCRLVQIGGDDSPCSLAFGAVLIASVSDWLNENHRQRDDKSRRIDCRLMRKVESGNISFCRVDISSAMKRFKTDDSHSAVARVARVKITTDDRGIVQTERYERQFAMLVADFCRCYSDSYVKRGEPPLDFTPDTLTFLQELHEQSVADQLKADLEKLNGERFFCQRRTAAGFCSPCKFDCPCFKNGMCVDASEVNA